ncbi:MAG: ElyC/SanA/YdcF family protein, partial [Desulfobacteraceae bacterium]
EGGMIFVIKKLISPLLTPLSIGLALALAGLFCLWFTRKQRTGKVLATLSFLLIGALSYGAVSHTLLRPLEQQYPPMEGVEGVKGIKWIVVLGGGIAMDPGLPLSTSLPEAPLIRLSEGIYLYNRLPGTRLVLTGITPQAEVMAAVAREWGVKEEDIVLETKAEDTKDHPIYVKKIVGTDRFILVTSAAHMPRAMSLFRKQGMTPVPAPTDYRVREGEGEMGPTDFFPRAEGLEEAERAVHEYLGMVWGKLRGQMAP